MANMLDILGPLAIALTGGVVSVALKAIVEHIRRDLQSRRLREAQQDLKIRRAQERQAA